MYRRLVTFSLSVVFVALVALVIPLGLAVRDLVRAEEISHAADHARATANSWEKAWQKARAASPNDDRVATPDVRIPPGEGEVTLLPPGRQPIGAPVDPRSARAVEAAKKGQSANDDVGDMAFSTAPVILDDKTGVVLVTLDAAELREGLAGRLLVLAAVSVALLGFSAIAAWLLARRTARPISELAATADTMADGDLSARAEGSDIKEVQDVSTALNRLAARVEELLDDERATAAELAHQLRTPLTVLSVDIDGVADPEVRGRLEEDVLALQRQTDEIITAARRSQREGLRAGCDASKVVAERTAFWGVLAEDQGRPAAITVAPGPLWVRLTEDDLATLLDILLQNVFLHSPEGTAYEVSLGEGRPAGAVLMVRDYGDGFRDGNTEQRTGTTGLGLSIAERLAVASGGGLECTNDHGAVVVVTLGPPRE